MSEKASNFVLNKRFNVNYDIVWSFKFLLSGGTTDYEGGFTTFLKSDGVILTGGDNFISLGYSGLSETVMFNTIDVENPNCTPILIEVCGDELLIEQEVGSEFNNPGISGAFLAVAFDTTGLFALSAGVNDCPIYSGVTLDGVYKNALIIRGGAPGYELLYNIPLSSMTPELSVLQTSEKYCWLRLRLGDVCSTIYIDFRYDDDSSYTSLTSLPLELDFNEATFMNVGMSYAAPVSAGSVNLPAIMRVKNFHVEGQDRLPSIVPTGTVTYVGLSGIETENDDFVAAEDDHIVLA